MKEISRFVLNHKKFLFYFMISCFVTVLDISISALGERFVVPDLVHNTIYVPIVSNAIGVITGFIVQYFLCSKNVYNKSNIRSFLYFFLTFLIGLVLAEGIIYFFRTIVFENEELLYQLPVFNFEISISFLISKIISIIIPFFVMYFLRKKLIGQEN